MSAPGGVRPPLPARPVVLSFDDGYASLHRHTRAASCARQEHDPCGRVDATVAAAVRDAGFLDATTTRAGRASPAKDPSGGHRPRLMDAGPAPRA